MSSKNHNATLNDLHNELAEARKRYNNVRKEIKEIKDRIIEVGGNPTGKIDLSERNKRIRTAFQANISVLELGKQFGISEYRVKEICKRKKK